MNEYRKRTERPFDSVPTARFDFRDYAPAERLAEFQLLTSSYYQVQAADKPETFQAEALGFRVDDLVLNRAAFSPARFTRDERHLKSGKAPFLVLQHQLAGSELLLMEHGKVYLQPGHIYLRDWSCPFVSQSTEMRLDSIIIPRHRLRSAEVLYNAMPVISWPADSPDGQVLAGLWISLLEWLPRMSLDKAQVLTAALLTFVDTLIGYGAKARPATTLHAMEQFLLLRLRQEIGVDELCRHFNVSRSQVYRLFEPHDGVKNYIKRVRLQRCYEDLLRADAAHARVADIASSWGFQDQSLFSRQFRAAFGQTPSALLRQVPDMPASVRTDFEEAPLESKSYRNYLAWLQQAASVFLPPSSARQ